MITTFVIMRVQAARRGRTAGAPGAAFRYPFEPIVRPITRGAFDSGVPHPGTANDPLSFRQPQPRFVRPRVRRASDTRGIRCNPFFRRPPPCADRDDNPRNVRDPRSPSRFAPPRPRDQPPTRTVTVALGTQLGPPATSKDVLRRALDLNPPIPSPVYIF